MVAMVAEAPRSLSSPSRRHGLSPQSGPRGERSPQVDQTSKDSRISDGHREPVARRRFRFTPFPCHRFKDTGGALLPVLSRGSPQVSFPQTGPSLSRDRLTGGVPGSKTGIGVRLCPQIAPPWPKLTPAGLSGRRARAVEREDEGPRPQHHLGRVLPGLCPDRTKRRSKSGVDQPEFGWQPVFLWHRRRRRQGDRRGPEGQRGSTLWTIIWEMQGKKRCKMR